MKISPEVNIYNNLYIALNYTLLLNYTFPYKNRKNKLLVSLLNGQVIGFVPCLVAIFKTEQFDRFWNILTMGNLSYHNRRKPVINVNTIPIFYLNHCEIFWKQIIKYLTIKTDLKNLRWITDTCFLNQKNLLQPISFMIFPPVLWGGLRSKYGFKYILYSGK